MLLYIISLCTAALIKGDLQWTANDASSSYCLRRTDTLDGNYVEHVASVDFHRMRKDGRIEIEMKLKGAGSIWVPAEQKRYSNDNPDLISRGVIIPIRNDEKLVLCLDGSEREIVYSLSSDLKSKEASDLVALWKSQQFMDPYTEIPQFLNQDLMWYGSLAGYPQIKAALMQVYRDAISKAVSVFQTQKTLSSVQAFYDSFLTEFQKNVNCISGLENVDLSAEYAQACQAAVEIIKEHPITDKYLQHLKQQMGKLWGEKEAETATASLTVTQREVTSRPTMSSAGPSEGGQIAKDSQEAFKSNDACNVACNIAILAIFTIIIN